MLHQRLRAKGWSEAEMSRLHDGFARAKARAHPAAHFVEHASFYLGVALCAIGTLLVSVVVAPLLLLLTPWFVATTLILLGLCLGALFALLVSDLEWLEGKHHLLAGIVILTVAVTNVALIAQRITHATAMPYILGFLFGGALLVPYLYHLSKERRRTRG
jgi:hypothetical protein